MKTFFIRCAIALTLFIWSSVVFSQSFIPVDLSLADTLIAIPQLRPTYKTVHPVAQQAIGKGEKPGEFKNVKYKLSGNVATINNKQRNQLTMRQNGIIDISGQPRFVPHPDSIYVDTESDLVFQAAPVSDQEMILFQPRLSSVFEDVDIPDQEAGITLANTIDLAKNVVASSVGVGGAYAVQLTFDKTRFQIHKEKEGALDVLLNGEIVLSNPRIEGKYTKHDGYKLIYKASEMVNLQVEATMSFKKSQEIPIWGAELKAGDLGACKVTLSLLVDVKGDITLKADIDQGFEMALGAKGSTCYFIPTGIENISTFDQYCHVAYEVKTEMQAFAGVMCQAKLKIKSYDVLNVYAKGGFEGTVTTQNQVLNADIGARIKAGGKIISKSFTVCDKYYSLYKIQIADAQGYKMMIHEACAYGDFVAGEIYNDKGANPAPYEGAVKVSVKRINGQTEVFDASTNSEGLFLARNIPLKNGDIITVGLPGVAAVSRAISATIPFKDVGLLAADYHNGTAYGMVAASKSKWAKMAAQPSQTPIPQGLTERIGGKGKAIIGQMSPITKISDYLNQFRQDLVIYKGPIEFTVKPIAPPLTATGKPSTGKPILRGTTEDKVRPLRGQVQSPMGLFSISGLALSPNQQVQARIELEGFVITSDWIETDGLLVSEIEHTGLEFKSALKTETISAQNSFVLVSAIRGGNAPSGKVTLLKGADATHASVIEAATAPEFPEVKKGVIWFSKTVELKPLSGYAASAIAETGSWQSTFTYHSPADVIDPRRNQKHPFEKVTYLYKGIDLGYSSFFNQCASCTSPANVVQKIGSGRPSHQIPGAVIKPPQQNAPIIQPKVGGGLVR
jgi:hypothetical protein